MKILLDTNFILTCVKQKIDFFSLADELFDEKLIWVIPSEVLDELEQLSEKEGMRTEDKKAAGLSLKILRGHKLKEIKLKDKNVDRGLAEYANTNEIVLATLDRELKKKARFGILTIRGKKNLALI